MAIVRWTGQQARPDKRGKLKLQGEQAPASLNRIDPVARRWVYQVQGTESVFYRAIGSAEAPKAKPELIGQRWLKGLRSGRSERTAEARWAGLFGLPPGICGPKLAAGYFNRTTSCPAFQLI